MTEDPSAYFTIPEFAKILGFSESTIGRYCDEGTLHYWQVSKESERRIPGTELERHIQGIPLEEKLMGNNILKYYTIPDFAKILKFAECTIDRWCDEGKLKYRRFERKGPRYIPGSELERHLITGKR